MCKLLGLFGFIWVFVCLFGFIWVYLGLFWVYLGFIWVYLVFIWGLFGIIWDLRIPGGAQKLCRQQGCRPSGDMVKLRSAPPGDALVWVSARSAIREAGEALQSN